MALQPGKWSVFGVVSAGILVGGMALSRGQETAMKNDKNIEETTRTTINSFNEAFNRHDAAAVAALLTEDTVFEDTSPAPDGRRVEGKAAVAEFWRIWFARNPDARFETEEMIVNGNRAVVRWTYRKTRSGEPWHLRGGGCFQGPRWESGGEIGLREGIKTSLLVHF